MTKDELFYKQKNIYEIVSEAETGLIYDFAEGYKKYIAASKTERLAVKEAIKLAEARGFVPYVFGSKLKAGDKVYFNNRGRALMLAVIGSQPLSSGINLAAAHVDSPRLDLKQVPTL
jgi:aspartyl aminopeptidase